MTCSECSSWGHAARSSLSALCFVKTKSHLYSPFHQVPVCYIVQRMYSVSEYIPRTARCGQAADLQRDLFKLGLHQWSRDNKSHSFIPTRLHVYGIKGENIESCGHKNIAFISKEIRDSWLWSHIGVTMSEEHRFKLPQILYSNTVTVS